MFNASKALELSSQTAFSFASIPIINESKELFTFSSSTQINNPTVANQVEQANLINHCCKFMETGEFSSLLSKLQQWKLVLIT